MNEYEFSVNLLWILLAFGIIAYFRKHVAALLDRVRRIESHGRVIEFHEDHPIKLRAESREEVQRVAAAANDDDPTRGTPHVDFGRNESVFSQRPGNVYWLAWDLILAYDSLMRGADQDFVVDQVRRGLHHAEQLGLQTSTEWKDLKNICTKLIHTDFAAMPRNQRFSLGVRIHHISDMFGKHIERQQVNFEPHPLPDADY